MTIESEEFYNLCQRYRFANICNQAEVSEVYQDLINFIDAEITSLREQLEKAKKDGKRYNRLRVLGCAVFGSNQLENGTVIRFQTLDEVVDLDLDRHKSRGEAIDNAMRGKG